MKYLIALLFCGCVFGQINGPSAAQTSKILPTTIACTASKNPPLLLYNDSGTQAPYTCGPSGFYIQAPGGSTSTLTPAAAAYGAGGAAGSNTVTGPSQSEPLASPSGTLVPYVYNQGATGAGARTQTSKNKDVVSVLDFDGCKNDGSVDCTQAFNDALTWANAQSFGGTVTVPCGNNASSYYKISGPIGHMNSNTSLVGTGFQACLIANNSSATNANAPPILDLVGSNNVTISNIWIEQNSTTYVPQCAIFTARTSPSSTAGEHSFNNLFIIGYFSKAVEVDISSESNTHNQIRLQLKGGGASTVYYTAAFNYLSVTGNGTTPTASFASNLTSYWAGSSVNSEVAADGVTDIVETTTGNHNYEGLKDLALNPALTSNTNSAFHFIGGTTFPNTGSARVNSSNSVGTSRSENYEYGVRFDKALDGSAVAYHNFEIRNFTQSTSAAGGTIYCVFADDTTTLQNVSIHNNYCDQNTAVAKPTSSVYNLTDSSIFEPNYQVVYRNTVANSLTTNYVSASDVNLSWINGAGVGFQSGDSVNVAGVAGGLEGIATQIGANNNLVVNSQGAAVSGTNFNSNNLGACASFFSTTPQKVCLQMNVNPGTGSTPNPTVSFTVPASATVGPVVINANSGINQWNFPIANMATSNTTGRNSSGILQGLGSTPAVANGTGTVTIGANSTNVAGFVTSGTTGAVSFTLTWAALSYGHRAVCRFTDETTAVDVNSVNTTQATPPTTTTLTATGTVVSGDIISYSCSGF